MESIYSKFDLYASKMSLIGLILLSSPFIRSALGYLYFDRYLNSLARGVTWCVPCTGFCTNCARAIEERLRMSSL